MRERKRETNERPIKPTKLTKTRERERELNRRHRCFIIIAINTIENSIPLILVIPHYNQAFIGDALKQPNSHYYCLIFVVIFLQQASQLRDETSQCVHCSESFIVILVVRTWPSKKNWPPFIHSLNVYSHY